MRSLPLKTMSDFAIRAENLSKRYRIGLMEERPKTLVGAAASLLKSPLRNFRRLRALSRFNAGGQEAGESEDVIWALKDVSFDVRQGEVVGVIGRNGAGKSTLLKVLSRVTHPTSGRVVLEGRISSLLEVGTGFHPELTGRENIYLNGTILGMTRREIDRKFDEIVDFSGVEKFIDTPVKRYSSGMAVRLAFSVAAHLEPEILLVDEVLAVGDAEFQKKCLGKMGEVTQEGRTVLFVSHNLGAISTLCPTSILLERGTLRTFSESRVVVQDYLNLVENTGSVVGKSGYLQIRDLKVRGQSERPISSEETILAEFGIHMYRSFWNTLVHFTIRDMNNAILVHERIDSKRFPVFLEAGNYRVELRLPSLHLRPGLYSCNVKVVVDDVGGRKRVISDPIMLNIHGGESSEFENPALLEPNGSWVIDTVR